MDKVAYHNMVINVATGIGTLATINVYAAGTANLSTIYSDTAGTAESNPFNTDANGRFSFYADPGEYDVKVSGAGITTYTLEDVTILAPSSNVIRTEPTTGEYLLKKLRVDADMKTVIVTHPDTAES